MSHSITLFNELSIKDKLLVLVNSSNYTSTKVRIRKTEILTKSADNSGYKLNQNKKLIFLENHLNLSSSNENKRILNQFLNDIKQFELTSKIKVEELQKSAKLNQSRLITTKQGLVNS